MERSESPGSIVKLFGIDAPDVVALAFRLLALLVVSGDVLLMPKIIADLCAGSAVVISTFCQKHPRPRRQGRIK
jgi:hypothetical protein